MELKEYFRSIKKAAVGFSGGVDSVYLLYAARNYGVMAQPYFVKTAFQPQFELDDAMRAAREIGAELRVIEYDILSDKRIADNPPDRCYFCKKVMFEAIKRYAVNDGYDILLDGTNASDNLNDRPGIKALGELSVCSPLRECGLTKERIRELSREAGLFTWDKPAYACLATRISSGDKITKELLGKIEKTENLLFKLGFSDFRVRIFHGAAKLQIKEEQMEKTVRMRADIEEGAKEYFNDIFLDLKGR